VRWSRLRRAVRMISGAIAGGGAGALLGVKLALPLLWLDPTGVFVVSAFTFNGVVGGACASDAWGGDRDGDDKSKSKSKRKRKKSKRKRK
jgi:hypothetical protein